MPFTTAHTAGVLPLKHLSPRWFSLTGLMAGAMSPDLIYFLMLDTSHRGFGHSWSGLFIFCLPAGIVFSFVFHHLFKRNFLLNLPRPFDRWFSGLAFSPFAIKGLRAWIILTISVLIGALSHFAWDSFTHAGGEMVKLIPILSDKTTIFGYTRSNFRYLQHLSSLVGIVLAPLYILRFRLIPSPVSERLLRSPGQKLRFWLVGGLAACGFAVASVLVLSWLHEWPGGAFSLSFRPLQTFGLGGWAGFFYAVCLYTLVRGRRNIITM